MKKYKMILIASLGFLLTFLLIAVSFRVRKDIKKKLNFENTYAIQNVETGNALRPYNANIGNGVDLISYPLKNWECITWEMIEIEDNTYLLKDLFTEKTFQPKSKPKSGVTLWQKSLGGNPYQYWEFLKQSDENYLIRLKGTKLYITVSSNKINSPIILMPKQNNKSQLWKLVRQTPWI
jgi:hypothetical protein